MFANSASLPIVGTIFDIFRRMWAQRAMAARYGAVPFAIMATMDLAGTLAGINVLSEQLWMAAASIVALIVFAPLTVSWFRCQLGGIEQRPLFTIGSAEWGVIRLNIVLSFVLLGLLAIAAGIVLGVASIFSGLGETARMAGMALLAAPAVIVIAWVVTRLTYAIALASLGRDSTLGLAWKITDGFGLRFTVLHAIVFAISAGGAQLVFLAQDALGAWFGIADEDQAGAWTLFLSINATLFNTVVYLLMMATLYAVVIRKVDVGELGLGMGLLAPGRRARLRQDTTAAMAYLAKVRAEGSKATTADFRQLIDRCGSHFPLPAGTSVTRVDCRGVPAVWVDAHDVRRDHAVLYLHGGGFWAGSSVSHARAAADIGAAAKCRVLVVDYRRAPEHPFPAAVDDCVAAYAWLLGQDFDADAIALAGDSAGGGLAISTMLAARERKLALPAAAACLSPWVDLTCSSPTYRFKAAEDPIGSHDSLAKAAVTYIAGGSAKSPLASPIFADLSGLPPLLIQVGSREILLGDAILLARTARTAGVAVTFEQWPGMIHNWHMLADLMEDGRYANARIGEFLRDAWGSVHNNSSPPVKE